VIAAAAAVRGVVLWHVGLPSELDGGEGEREGVLSWMNENRDESNDICKGSVCWRISFSPCMNM
jgi:hypothetical protein